ncbi:MAG: formate dehydrogenase accessory sulfurtransferase FdhD [Lentimonas sp.]
MPASLSPKPVATVRTSVKVIKQRVVGTKKQTPEKDFLAIEDPLEIVFSHQKQGKTIEKQFAVTMRTPGHDRELIHGFLYCEGIIQSATNIADIEFAQDKANAAPTRAIVHLANGIDPNALNCERNFAIHSSCGVCGTTEIGHLSIPKALKFIDDIRVDSKLIHDLPERMQTKQETFRQTGGLHASAIFTNSGELVASNEDIGRHNALDKVIGTQLLADPSSKPARALCVSGRMSYEIIQKALIARLPIIAGVGAPSSLAVALANDFNITLIGFVRNNSYNIYSCPERLV